MKKKTFKGLESIKEILAAKNFLDRKKYITKEFQDFGLRLAKELGDERHKSLYIKLAKTVPRQLLEEARIFIKDASNVKSKARLFMWKIKQLKNESAKNTGS